MTRSSKQVGDSTDSTTVEVVSAKAGVVTSSKAGRVRLAGSREHLWHFPPILLDAISHTLDIGFALDNVLAVDCHRWNLGDAHALGVCVVLVGLES